MAGWTNRAKYRNLEWILHRESMPAKFYLAMVTNASVNPDVVKFSELTEIADGNGYDTGGYELNPNATDFDTLTQDDINNLAKAYLKDIIWTGDGGSIPASGDDAQAAVLLDDNAVIADREVLYVFDFDQAVSVSNGQPITLRDFQIQITES